MGNKILLAFDGSPGGMQAVNLVGSLLGSSDFTVCLLHVIRAVRKQHRSIKEFIHPDNTWKVPGWIWSPGQMKPKLRWCNQVFKKTKYRRKWLSAYNRERQPSFRKPSGKIMERLF